MGLNPEISSVRPTLDNQPSPGATKIIARNEKGELSSVDPVALQQRVDEARARDRANWSLPSFHHPLSKMVSTSLEKGISQNSD